MAAPCCTVPCFVVPAVSMSVVASDNLGCVHCNENACKTRKEADVKPSRPSVYMRELPSHLVSLESTEGTSRFKRALDQGTAECFLKLVSQWQTQTHPAYCGLTTLTTILNALNVDPSRVWMFPWRWFEDSLLGSCIDLEDVKKVGITVDQLAQTARCNGAAVEVYRDLDKNGARNLLLDCVRKREGFYVAVSFSRPSLGQTGDGHFSPIAAFDKESDSVLILDTARFKYGPYWVSLEDLHQATQPIDSVSNRRRGYLTFEKSKSGELHMFC